MGHAHIGDALQVDDAAQLHIILIRCYQNVCNTLKDLSVCFVGIVEPRGVKKSSGTPIKGEIVKMRLFGAYGSRSLASQLKYNLGEFNMLVHDFKR